MPADPPGGAVVVYIRRDYSIGLLLPVARGLLELVALALCCAGALCIRPVVGPAWKLVRGISA